MLELMVKRFVNFSRTAVVKAVQKCQYQVLGETSHYVKNHCKEMAKC